MKKQIMNVSILGELVLADTDNYVDISTLLDAGNKCRLLYENKKPYQLNTFLASVELKNYIKEASEAWNIPEDKFIISGGRRAGARVRAHISIAVLLAEKISKKFHVYVHKVFIEGQLLQHRLEGGEEFKRFNDALVDFLPSPRGNDDARRINAAKLIREKCKLTKPEDEELETWNQEAADSVAQALRVDMLSTLTKMLRMGVVRDFEHLKEIIEKL